MSRREDVDTSIWSDPDFLGFSPAAKLVYVWSFTNPRCGMSGLYKVVRQAVEMESGVTGKRLDDAFAELAAARFVFFDGRVLWVRSRIKHLRSKSPNIAKSIARDVESMMSHDYAAELLRAYARTDWLATVLEPLLKTLPKGSDPSDGSERFQGRAGHGQLLEGPTSATPSTPVAAAATTSPDQRIHDLDEARSRLKTEAEAIDRVWAGYVQARVSVFGKQSVPKLSRDRRDLIARRLKEWPEPDLADAVRGWRHFPHNRGENDRHTPYCDLKLLLRDAGQIERFRDAERAGGTGRDELNDWLGGSA